MKLIKINLKKHHNKKKKQGKEEAKHCNPQYNGHE
jgi:hypothetical protein